MDLGSIPEALFARLDNALSLENKFKAPLGLPYIGVDHQELTIGMRDGSAHVLRCLKMWYELPSDVFFVATNVMDRFISKMQVKSKHLACMSIASFQLACNMVGEGLAPNAREIITISQAKCSVADLLRMQEVVSSKLDAAPGSLPITAFTLINIFHDLLTFCDFDKVYCSFVNYRELIQQLEIVLCDASCGHWRPSEVALSVLCYVFDQGYSRQEAPSLTAPGVYNIVAVIAHIHDRIKTTEEIFTGLHTRVVRVLNRYNDQLQVQYRQRLVWRVSSRTMRKLRPTGNLVPTLQTIDEHGQLVIPSPSSDETSSSSNSSSSKDIKVPSKRLHKTQRRKNALKQ